MICLLDKMCLPYHCNFSLHPKDKVPSVCVCVCVFVRVHIGMCTCMCAYTNVSVLWVGRCMRACVNAFIQTVKFFMSASTGEEVVSREG